MSSTSTSSSLDHHHHHHRNPPVQLPTGRSTSSKSSSCSSASSHRSDERVYSAPAIPPPPPFPTLYFNPFTHLLQSSCSSNQDKVSSPSFEERCCSVSSSSQSPLPIIENNHCSPSNSSTPLNENHDAEEEDENTKPKSLIKQRPCSR